MLKPTALDIGAFRATRRGSHLRQCDVEELLGIPFSMTQYESKHRQPLKRGGHLLQDLADFLQQLSDSCSLVVTSQQIYELRRRRGCSPQRFAELLRVKSARTVERWEKGEAMPQHQAMLALRCLRDGDANVAKQQLKELFAYFVQQRRLQFKLTFTPKKLRRFRELFQLSQGDLASLVGRKVVTVRNWERTRNPAHPDGQSKQKLQQAFQELQQHPPQIQ